MKHTKDNIDSLKVELAMTENLLKEVTRELANRSNNSAGWWNDPRVSEIVYNVEKFLGEKVAGR